MSQVNRKEQEINEWCARINAYCGELSSRDNNDKKWYSITHFVDWGTLFTKKAEWQAQMVAYYIRLTKYTPTVDQKEYYDGLLDAINQLVGLLND